MTAPDPMTPPQGPVIVLPVLVPAADGAAIRHPGGDVEHIGRAAAATLFKSQPLMVCHTGFTARRLGLSEPGRRATGLPAHADVAELFAFVHPARPIIPSAAGLAQALELSVPHSVNMQADVIHQAALKLLHDLQGKSDAERHECRVLSAVAARAGWPWSPFIEQILGPAVQGLASFDTWKRLPEWQDHPPRGEAASRPVTDSEARLWLAEILGPDSEHRAAQFDYAANAVGAFAPRERRGTGHVLIAEAGTGVGKTLGYLSPATLWARRNDGIAWISTYTKNLQRQLDQELSRVFPDPREKREKVTILKGRENYLCLLNYDEATSGFALAPTREMILLLLVARWIPATRDGDISGGDFPGWINAEYGRTVTLTDRRGECIYGACRHYRRCFIERNNRAAARAEIVVANHALTMSRAAMNPRSLDESGAADHAGERQLPQRYVFDEGHHLFDAADGIFAAHMTVSEGAELRRWLRGRDGGRSSRVRGLRERLTETAVFTTQMDDELAALEHAALILPGEGWRQRLQDNVPFGMFERFIATIRAQTLARTSQSEQDYDLECEPFPLTSEVGDALPEMMSGLRALAQPLHTLAKQIGKEVDTADTSIAVTDLSRLRALLRGLRRRTIFMVEAWLNMLEGLASGQSPEGFIEWFGISREARRESDAGFFRHHLDPTRPFADEVLSAAHGALITSATLRDRGAGGDGEDAGWQHAEIRSGAQHLIEPAQRATYASPFDYARQSRVIVITDVELSDARAVADAYYRLIAASGGGALGLFTSIRRLRDVHQKITSRLEAQNLPLFAQHVDALDTGTLVDLFRADTHASLLGTDAMRDGVDVPGNSLRLVVFDRVPWPRPDILHKARASGLGIAKYNDVIVRMRLAQAFGRLIRRATDKGVFVILGAATPSRVLAGLPQNIEITRTTLDAAVPIVHEFLQSEPGDAR